MRTLMYIGSIAMIAAGIFCFANGSATFISLAFVIGIVFAVMGIIEILTGRRANFDAFGGGVNLMTDGVLMLIFGVVVLSGQVTDDFTANMLFAMWLVIEGVLAVGKNAIDLTSNNNVDTAEFVLDIAILLLGIYMFFDNRLININSIFLLGATMMLLGLRRFKMAFEIQYNRTGFLTGNQEKLEAAEEAEKRALAKAKEGIREQKIAQKRIASIKEDIAQERSVIREATIRKQMAEEENEK